MTPCRRKAFACRRLPTIFQVIGDDPMDGLNGLCEGKDYQVTRARRHLDRGDYR